MQVNLTGYCFNLSFSRWLVINLDVTEAARILKSSGKRFGEREKKSVISKLESNFFDSGNNLRTFIFTKNLYQKSSGRVHVESIITEHKGRRAYQTYVTLDDKTSRPIKFPINGFKYYKRKKRLIKNFSYSPSCLLTRFHSMWPK